MDPDSTGFRGGRGALPFHSGKRRDPRHIRVLFENISDSIEGRAAIGVRIVGHAQPERSKLFRFAHGIDELAAKASGEPPCRLTAQAKERVIRVNFRMYPTTIWGG
jgi:hypothetical protein